MECCAWLSITSPRISTNLSARLLFVSWMFLIKIESSFSKPPQRQTGRKRKQARINYEKKRSSVKTQRVLTILRLETTRQDISSRCLICGNFRPPPWWCATIAWIPFGKERKLDLSRVLPTTGSQWTRFYHQSRLCEESGRRSLWSVSIWHGSRCVWWP